MKKTLILLGMLAMTPLTKAQIVLEALDAPDKPKCTPPVNNFTPSDKCLELVCDKNYGDGDHDFVYCAVQGPNGKRWLNLNLGAEYANIHSSEFNPQAQLRGFDDWRAFGSLFQDGRKADGHELVTYYHSTAKQDYKGTTDLYIDPTDDFWYVNRKYAVTDTPQNPLNSNNSYVLAEEWMTNRDIIANLWQGSMLNNPCPDGYRIMSDADIKSLLVDEEYLMQGDIKQGLLTTSIIQNRLYPNLVLMTSPSVLYTDRMLHNVQNQGRFQKADSVLKDESISAGGTSSLWILLNEDPSEREHLQNTAYVYDYGQPPYGWSNLDLHRRDSYMIGSYYGIFDRGFGGHEYGYSSAGKTISSAIRCVER